MFRRKSKINYEVIPMTLGEFIQMRRTALKLSRNMLATRAGISHTEVHRIETGERMQPSLKVLSSLAIALEVPQEELMKYAGYIPTDDTPAINRVFPGLKTEKQKETVGKIVDGLSRNSDLADEDLDDLYRQVEMFIDYARKKKDTE